jgi:hypothetical protein
MSSANTSMHGCGGFSCSRGGDHRCTSRCGNNNNIFKLGNYTNSNNNRGGGHHNNGKRLICQVCDKEGHTVVQCRYRFDGSYRLEKHASAATTHSYGIAMNWYTNKGATDYIIGELEKLDMRTKYNGTDQVHTTNGTGTNITHVGHSVLSTPSHNLVLKNILHVPEADKNPLSVYRLTTYNHTSLEYFSNFFLVKDLDTRMPLLKGSCRNGFYPLPSKAVQTHAFGVTKPSFAKWHSHLGHPSSSTVHKVISKNNLPCLSESTTESASDACQKAKSHQLPYTSSSGASSAPL